MVSNRQYAAGLIGAGLLIGSMDCAESSHIDELIEAIQEHPQAHSNPIDGDWICLERTEPPGMVEVRTFDEYTDLYIGLERSFYDFRSDGLGPGDVVDYWQEGPFDEATDSAYARAVRNVHEELRSDPGRWVSC